MAIGQYRTALVVLPLILIAGLAARFSFFGIEQSDAETSAQTAVAVPREAPAVQPDALPAVQQTALGPPAAESLGRLRIARQSFSRGGLGSKALVTFTLRNDNDYAVKDLEILCAFRSKDGRYSTERRRIITDTVDTRSRKTFPATLIGFINIKASQANCSLLTASRA